MEKLPDYSSFKTEDFIGDEFFQDWIFHPDEKSDAFWKNWLGNHPEKQEEMANARKVLLTLDFKTHFPTDERVAGALNRNEQMIRFQEKQFRIRVRRWIAAAACVLILVLGYGILRYERTHSRIAIETAYGETRTVFLPDGSRVVLNAHSSLSYPKYQTKDNPGRTIWLEGEAFFEVKPLKDAGYFRVHTPNLSVIVLGTSFDVKSRNTVEKVLLKTGSVRLEFKKNKQQDIVLRPGELIAYNIPEDKVTKTKVDPEVYTAWMDKKMILQAATVKEIARYIEEYYGRPVRFEDTSIANKKMEGTLMLDNLEDVLFVISTALDIQIEEDGDTLVFRKR